MSYNMPFGATQEQYDEWCGEHDFRNKCSVDGCIAEVQQVIDNGLCEQHAIEDTMYWIVAEEDSQARQEMVEDLMRLGWVAQ
jgi:hypothetical protein